MILDDQGAQVEQVEAERDEAISAADEQAAAAQRDAEQAAAKIAAAMPAEARGQASVLREEVARLRAELTAKGENAR